MVNAVPVTTVWLWRWRAVGQGLAHALVGVHLCLRVCGSLRRYTIAAALLAVVVGFLYWSPWVYGLPLNGDAIAARRWMPGWD